MWLYDEGQKKANVMKADARGLSSVSLAADSSLCGGSLLGKRVCGGEAVAFRSPPPPLRPPLISLCRPHAARSRRLCQPP